MAARLKVDRDQLMAQVRSTTTALQNYMNRAKSSRQLRSRIEACDSALMSFAQFAYVAALKAEDPTFQRSDGHEDVQEMVKATNNVINEAEELFDQLEQVEQADLKRDKKEKVESAIEDATKYLEDLKVDELYSAKDVIHAKEKLDELKANIVNILEPAKREYLAALPPAERIEVSRRLNKEKIDLNRRIDDIDLVIKRSMPEPKETCRPPW